MSSSMHTHVHLHSYAGCTWIHKCAPQSHILWSLAATSQGFLPGPPLTLQQSSQLIIRLWLLQRTVEQPVWSGGIPGLWWLGAAVTFILLGKVREVDRDPATTGPATLLWCSRCLPRSLWLTIPKVALSGGDSDLCQPVSPWASEQASSGVLPLGVSARPQQASWENRWSVPKAGRAFLL